MVIGLAGLVVLAGVVLLVWPVPTLFYSYVPDPKDRSAAEATTRTGMLAGLAGLAALGTFWLNSRVYRITARTFEVTEQGHITDRYTKAIDQLGDDKLDIRLGGIYALERLAADSKRDHPTVVEVLSAFVRERSKPPQVPAHSKSVESTPSLGTDVQAALTVLGRLPAREYVKRGDLLGAHLPNVVLATAEPWTKLVGANLAGVNFSGANLTQAMLAGVNLEAAGLISADLSGAVLAWSNMTGAFLTGANLANATINEANLTDADLGLADLTDADLRGANLAGAKGLTQAQVNSALGNQKTSLPEGLARPEAWADPPKYGDFPNFR